MIRLKAWEDLQEQTRKSVEAYVKSIFTEERMLTSCRELLLLVAVTAAIERKPLNGVGARTEHEPCATLAVYVRTLLLRAATILLLMAQLDYAKLTRKMGSKSSTTGSNLRPKDMSQGSP